MVSSINDGNIVWQHPFPNARQRSEEKICAGIGLYACDARVLICDMFVAKSLASRLDLSRAHEKGARLAQRLSFKTFGLFELNESPTRAHLNYTRIVCPRIKTGKKTNIRPFYRVKAKWTEIMIMHDATIERMVFIDRTERIARNSETSAKSPGKLSEQTPAFLVKDALVDD
ncbi:MAG: hypothetical protein R3C55_16165 [Parvularculaceae bacterium]